MNFDTHFLDPSLKSDGAERLEDKLFERVVGQERAIRALCRLVDTIDACLTEDTRPAGSYLLLGPTGTGKTLVVEAFAKAMHGYVKMIKINCAEYQYGHNTAKLLGSPPGYLGHRETVPLLNANALLTNTSPEFPYTIILFDEIEKASFELFQMLLAILDKAEASMGDNTKVDFSKTVIFMTSNLGSKEIAALMKGSIGFETRSADRDGLDQRIYKVAMEAARRHFTPEFFNRIDKTVVFRSLTRDQLLRIADILIGDLQHRVFLTDAGFHLLVGNDMKNFIVDEGYDPRYGARHLKRSIQRFLTEPLAQLVRSKQVKSGDYVYVDRDRANGEIAYVRTVPSLDGTGEVVVPFPPDGLARLKR